jgi:hypothetical protein
MLAHQGIAELIAETSDICSEGLVRGRCHLDRVFPDRPPPYQWPLA